MLYRLPRMAVLIFLRELRILQEMQDCQVGGNDVLYEERVYRRCSSSNGTRSP